MIAGRKPGRWEKRAPGSCRWTGVICSLQSNQLLGQRERGGGHIPTLMLGTYNIRFLTILCCGNVDMFTHLVHSLVCALQFQSALWAHTLQSIKHSWNLQIATHTHTQRGGGDIPTLMLGTYNIRFVTLLRCGNVYMFTCLLTWCIALSVYTDYSPSNTHETYR